MNRIKTLCWWRVGNSIAVDCHDSNGELVRFGFDEPQFIPNEESRLAILAQFFGAELNHDTDSEEFYTEAEESST